MPVDGLPSFAGSNNPFGRSEGKGKQHGQRCIGRILNVQWDSCLTATCW